MVRASFKSIQTELNHFTLIHFRGRMADKAAPVAPVQQQGLIKRLLELVMMAVSMVLVIFAWGEVGKAKVRVVEGQEGSQQTD